MIAWDLIRSGDCGSQTKHGTNNGMIFGVMETSLYFSDGIICKF